MKLNVSNLKKSHYDVKRNFKVPEILDGDLAYLCGVMAGDGHLGNGRSFGDKYEINCGGNPSDEIEFYDKTITQLFYKLFNVKIKPKLISGGTYGFRVGSKLIHRFFTDIIGLPKGKKYDGLKIPKLIKGEKELTKQFIIGLFDTDFGFTLKKRYKKFHYYPVICFVSKSKVFLKEVHKELKDYGIRLTKHYQVFDMDNRTKKGYTIKYRFEINGHSELVRWFRIFGTRHPKNIRKYQLWKIRNKNNKRVKFDYMNEKVSSASGGWI